MSDKDTDVWMVLRVKLPLLPGKTIENVAHEFENDVKPGFEGVEPARALDIFCAGLKNFATDFDVHYEYEGVRYGSKNKVAKYKN